ncbi:Uma2 family endonuclease [Streptomyces sp. NPDC001922]|uniref:Uma2 family endonuclease n=1 Tax=Streptomyces sp. NPDC001922 TaxID=3364624 RepID=UPI0036AB3BA2
MTSENIGTHRAQLSVEDFEQLTRSAPEPTALEFLGGRPVTKPGRDGTHGCILMWLLKQCLQQRPDLALYPEQGLKTEQHRKGRARPAGSLAPEGYFAGQREWSEPKGVLMAVDVTPHAPETDPRYRTEKRDGYAAADISVHLLIDRSACTVAVYSEPEGGKYRGRMPYPYGATVEIPAPVGITLATEKLKDYTH